MFFIFVSITNVIKKVNHDSSISVVTVHMLCDRGSMSDRGREFLSLLRHVGTSSGAHSAFYIVGTGVLCPRVIRLKREA
jgi:hypothetical protein